MKPLIINLAPTGMVPTRTQSSPGATLVERRLVGNHAFIGACAVVIEDVAAHVLVVGVPARIKKSLV